jgi:hypothetical protein
MIFLIGPNPEENDLNISTISFRDGREIFTFVEEIEGKIRPLVVGGVIPKFFSEDSAIKWIMRK